MVHKRLELVSMVTRSVYKFLAPASVFGSGCNRGGNIYVTEMQTFLKQLVIKGENGLETACNDPDMMGDIKTGARGRQRSIGGSSFL